MSMKMKEIAILETLEKVTKKMVALLFGNNVISPNEDSIMYDL